MRRVEPPGLFGFERISQPVAHRRRFVHRLARSTAVGLLLIGVSLLAGMLGYHALLGLSWVDAYVNAAMILSGMGPLASPTTVAGKIFAGTYALYSGIAVIAFAGVILAPVIHRFLHLMHAPADDRR
jgi:hypothetical protein